MTDVKVRLRGDTKNPTPFLKGTRESMDGISILWRHNPYLFPTKRAVRPWGAIVTTRRIVSPLSVVTT